MTVKELIEILKELDQNTDINVSSPCCKAGYPIEGIVKHTEFIERTKQDRINYIISDCIYEDEL